MARLEGRRGGDCGSGAEEKLHRGQWFFHTKWLDRDGVSPLRCVITRVAKGMVYYRPAGGGESMRCELAHLDDFLRGPKISEL